MKRYLVLGTFLLPLATVSLALGDPPDAAASADTEATKVRPATRTTFIEIPIVGEIGKEVFPEGVQEALSRAKQQHIQHVVFRFNTPGGLKVAAEEIARLTREAAADFTYYGVVERCLSAGVWPLVECDRILVTASSTIGAAVIYTVDPSTGKASSLDAKFLSAAAATLAAHGQAKGHSAVLLRAMVVQEAEVYAWSPAGAAVPQLFECKPEGKPASELIRIDGDTTIVTLTGAEAIKLGFAEDFEASGVGKAPEWKLGSKIGSVAMKKAATNAARTAKTTQQRAENKARDIERVRAWSVEIERLAIAAREQDPARFNDYTRSVRYSKTGRYSSVPWMGKEIVTAWSNTSVRSSMSAHSAQTWMSRADSAINAWKSIRAGIRDICNLMAKYPDVQFDEGIQIRLKSVDDEATSAINELLRRRNPYVVQPSSR